ncbi:unnamed protein product [Ilex paraguariensis]|uniref:RING-type E3 ubiquitin transferase n=1 Tax=Ilex paraguariensis TaxID=185542 RepID=A0ABC8TXC3_9AQUA
MASQDYQHSHWYFTDLSHSTEFHGQGLLIIFVFFFSIILLITYLLFTFGCRYRQFSSSNSANQSSASHHAIAVPAPSSLGLDASTIQSFPMFLHRKSSSSEDNSNVFRENECSICLGLFQDDEMVKVLPECLHAYHSECVDKWLSARSSCPLCRSSLDSNSSTAAHR